MISTADFGKGVRVMIAGEPYTILDVVTQSPSARGAATLVKIKARNLLNGKLVNETFKSGLKFEEPDVKFTPVQYLYSDDQDAFFMDQSSYEQFQLPLESLGDQVVYFNEKTELRALIFNDKVMNVELPDLVEIVVTSVEPATRGNTASGAVMTQATLENGLEISVPLHVKEGQIILVDPRTNSFHSKKSI